LSEAAAAGTANQSRIDPHVWRIAIVVVLGSIMSILDTTIVNVALHTLQDDLNATLAQIQWVLTGYLLALAAVIPVTGWAARRFGSKNVYLVSLVLFTVGSVLCGVATSTTELIVFRVLQGFGGGMLLPIGQLMLASAAGPSRMGRVMSIVAVPAMLAPILGPTIGGVIVDNLSWRWIFFVNVPIGIAAVIAAIRILPREHGSKTEPLDVTGFLLMAAGVPLLTYGLAEIGATGKVDSPRVIVPLLLGIGLIVGFVFHALRAKRPLLDMRLYSKATFASASLTMFFLGTALFGGMILLPLYWQEVRGFDALKTGLLIGPLGLGMALIMPLAGKLTDRYGGGPLALIGIIVTTAATVPFALIGAHTPITYLSGAMFIRGMGIGLAFMPAMTAAYASLKRSELSDAAPQLNIVQRIGGSIGTAILAVILQRALAGTKTLEAAAHAFGTAFWWSVGLSALAIIPCLVLVWAERAARGSREATPLPLAEQLAESVA
jgi:EmrB/QacA subfamily drug resistance transporter